ncbi:MAG: response regulator [Actinobacteria bacterium]|nr:response regulator [Actinomycetota bacterium]
MVDDDRLFLRLVELNLAKLGIKVLLADSGREAVRIASSARPDIILLDIMMPVMDGYEVLRQLKENTDTRDIPIVMLTAKSAREDQERCAEMGITAYITKPFKLEELRETVRRIIFPPQDNGR